MFFNKKLITKCFFGVGCGASVPLLMGEGCSNPFARGGAHISTLSSYIHPILDCYGKKKHYQLSLAFQEGLSRQLEPYLRGVEVGGEARLDWGLKASGGRERKWKLRIYDFGSEEDSVELIDVDLSASTGNSDGIYACSLLAFKVIEGTRGMTKQWNDSVETLSLLFSGCDRGVEKECEVKIVPTAGLEFKNRMWLKKMCWVPFKK